MSQKEINTNPVMNLVPLTNFSILRRFEAQSLIDSVLNSETNVDLNNKKKPLNECKCIWFPNTDHYLCIHIVCVSVFCFFLIL